MTPAIPIKVQYLKHEDILLVSCLSGAYIIYVNVVCLNAS